VEVIEPAQGLSLRGTSDDTLFSGDVGRQLLVKREQDAARSQPSRMLPPEPRVAVKVRERASRRAVKQVVEETEAAARALTMAEQWVGWDNQPVGVSLLKYVRLGRERRIHMLDTTPVAVP
jgi:hypothetical protein